MNSIEKFIKKIPLFSSLDDNQISYLVGAAVNRILQSGDFLFYEGETPDGVYIVMHGKLDVWKTDSRGNPELIASHEAGHIVGDMAVIDGKTRSASVKARETTEVLFISSAVFISFIKENESFLMALLSSFTQTIRKSNQTFVSQLKQKNLMLEEAYESLKNAQEEIVRSENLSVLGKFVSTIIHDLKNPISIIKNYGDMLENKVKDSKCSRYVDAIHSESERLITMVNEILDFSRGSIKLQLTPLTVVDFMNELSDNQKELLASRSVEIKTDWQYDGQFMADRERLRRVLINLINNAVKAMPSGGVLTLSTFPEGDNIVIEVKDNGVGMDKDVLDHVFDPFFTKSEMGGTGLGMMIVKNIIDAHRGHIKIKSRLGEGTVVTVKIPRLGFSF